MGGIVEMAIGVKCDRCGNRVPVEEDKEVDFYKSWSKRENTDDMMFVCVLNRPDGSTVDLYYEYLCPKCDKVVFNNMAKISPELAPPKKEEKKEKAKPEKKEEAKQEKKAEPEEEKKITIVDETEKVEETPPEESQEPGADYTDDDLFDD